MMNPRRFQVLLVCMGGLAVIGALSACLPASETGDNAIAATPAATTAAVPESTTPPAASPNVEKRTVTETAAIPFQSTTVADSSLAKGTRRVKVAGVPGVKTLVYEVTLVDGVPSGKTLLREEITKRPVNEVVAIGTKAAAPQCDPNYTGACVPIASDVDCAGGSGNGPAYVKGPVRVVGTDIYDLDRDGNGIGCE